MRKLLVALLALLIALPAAYAQERKAYGQPELDQMLAPVALYPDALLSQVLMASTYPLEVVEAARWSRAHPGVQGDEAVRAAADKDWDPSVKSLLAFPNVLTRMDENLDWTRRLGDAFLAQETQVMDTVQQLRQRAQASGHLAPDERQRVVADGRTIAIEPADPRVVYVPYYDPYVVYGPWWWSTYPPVLWAPWPGYAVAYPGYWWGVGIGITTGFFFGSMNWHHRHVGVAHVNNYYVRPGYVRTYGPAYKPMQPGRWQHDTWHRRGVGQRYEARRAEQRVQPMPPAFRAASPQQPRLEQRNERRVEARPEQRPPPRTEAPRPQPRGEARPEQRTQVRMEAPGPRPGVEARSGQRPQARPEHGARPRMETRGGGGGGGWREHAGRGQGRG